MRQLTSATLFSGGGGVDAGMIQAGFSPGFAIEYNERIAQCYADNFGQHIHCADVRGFDYKPYAGIDWLHLSPSCQSSSVANQNKGETDADKEAATAGAEAIHDMRPLFVTIENVQGYAKTVSWLILRDALVASGYHYDQAIVDASLYGVPQSRKRFIVRAVRKPLQLPAFPRKTARLGWFDSVEDLLDECDTDTLADWQKERLTEDYLRAFFRKREEQLDLGLFVDGCSAGNRPPTRRVGGEPAPTLTGGNGGRVHRIVPPLLLDGQNGSNPKSIRSAEEPALTVTNQNKGYFRALLPHPNAMNERFCVSAGNEPAWTVSTTLGRVRAVFLRVQGQNSGICVPDETPSPTVTATHDAAKYRDTRRGEIPRPVASGSERKRRSRRFHAQRQRPRPDNHGRQWTPIVPRLDGRRHG